MNPSSPSPPLMPWPAIIVLEDCFVPELAEMALRVAGDADFATISAVVAVRAYQAEQELAGRRN